MLNKTNLETLSETNQEIKMSAQLGRMESTPIHNVPDIVTMASGSAESSGTGSIVGAMVASRLCDNANSRRVSRRRVR